EAMIRISDAVPTLRIVLDHLPSLDPVDADRSAYDAALKEIGKRPQIYVKLSEIIHRVNGEVSIELNTYRARLDLLMGVFGDDRTGDHVPFEERAHVRVRFPQVPGVGRFDADAVRAIADGREHVLDRPGHGIHSIDHPRGRHSDPKLPVLHLLTVRTGARRRRARVTGSGASASDARTCTRAD